MSTIDMSKNEALDKKAENARELGLDYEPAQQEPGRNHYEDGDVFERIGAMKKQPSQQEPVAWGWAIMHSDGTYAYIRPRIADFFGSIQERDSYTSEDAKLADREWAGLAPHTIVTLYTSPPTLSLAQQDIQRLIALVRAQQITIDKLEAQLQARSAETREKNT